MNVRGFDCPTVLTLGSAKPQIGRTSETLTDTVPSNHRFLNEPQLSLIPLNRVADIRQIDSRAENGRSEVSERVHQRNVWWNTEF